MGLNNLFLERDMGKWRSSTWFLLAVLGLFLNGCTVTNTGPAPSPSPIPVMSSPEPVLPSPILATSSPEPIQPSRTPIGASPQGAEGPAIERPTFTPSPPGVPTVTPTPTIQPGLRAETLPRPLYFLAAGRQPLGVKQVWRLDPGASEIVAVTPAEMAVSSAAIWPGDGRLAYATEAGQLYAVWPGEAPRLLVDVGPSGEEGVIADRPTISGLVWSPDGERLAYSVWSQENSEADEADGLWLLTPAEGSQMKLLDNRYLDPEAPNVLDVRVARPLAWSPDGKALLVQMIYWEWTDVMWLEPLAPAADDSNLQDPQGLWVDGSWGADGRSVWLSGRDRAIVSDLARAERDQAEVTLLLDGDREALAFYRAQELPEGLAFLALDGLANETRLYLGRETATGFAYEAAGPADPLCSQGPVWDIAWDPTGQWAVVSCQGEVRLISLEGTDGENLTPFLEPLLMREQSAMFWGPKGGAVRDEDS
jgi:sugar lactone lactonase YvrE